MKKLLLICSIVLFFLSIYVKAFSQEVVLKTTLNKEVEETSGLIWINNTIITHNDSGSEPLLYEIDGSTGQILRTVVVNNASNVDWEDICFDDTYIYVGDFGNNNGTRKNLKIYRIRNEDFFETDNDEVEVDTISFHYADQTDFSNKKYSTNYDAEALIAYEDKLYIFTKNWGDYKSNIYAVPKLPGSYSLEKITTIDTEGLVTGAATNLDGDEILLVGYTLLGTDFMMVITNLNESDLTGLNTNRYDLSMPYSGSLQIEGVSYVTNSEVFISAEAYQDSEPALYQVTLSTVSVDKVIGDCCIYPNPVPSRVHINLDSFSGVEIYDMKGQLQMYSTESDIGLENLNVGVYVLKILNQDNSTVLSYKILKN